VKEHAFPVLYFYMTAFLAQAMVTLPRLIMQANGSFNPAELYPPLPKRLKDVQIAGIMGLQSAYHYFFEGLRNMQKSDFCQMSDFSGNCPFLPHVKLW